MISKEEAISLLRTEGCSEKIISHCINVSKYAKEIGEKASKDFELDINLIEIGGLLHDIGRSKINGIYHGVIGAEIIRNKGIDEKIALICERHIGSGIDKRDADKFGLPNNNYIPETIEERIVCHADNFFINGVQVNFEKVFQRFIIELGEGHSSIQRLLALQKDLQKYL
ncbi:MAG: HD domain-containing protein [Candidatus Methanofastidiosum sp.]|nr:HD domain-containing protein [Methanofastidiosum sp.]